MKEEIPKCIHSYYATLGMVYCVDCVKLAIKKAKEKEKLKYIQYKEAMEYWKNRYYKLKEGK